MENSRGDLCDYAGGHPALGATTIPEALRLAPGVEVAQIDSNKWSIGIRGFGSRLSRVVLVLIDGRTVYTTLLAGTYWEVQERDDAGRRPHRGDSRAWRHYLGTERGERRHQYHHQKQQGYPRRRWFGGRRKRGSGILQRPVRRRQWQELRLPRLLEGFQTWSAIPRRWRQLRFLAVGTGRIPHRLLPQAARQVHRAG